MRKHNRTINGHTTEVFNVWLNHHSNQNFYRNDTQLYHTSINKNIKINIKYSSRQRHRLTKNAFFMNQKLNDLKKKKNQPKTRWHFPPPIHHFFFSWVRRWKFYVRKFLLYSTGTRTSLPEPTLNVNRESLAGKKSKQRCTIHMRHSGSILKL